MCGYLILIPILLPMLLACGVVLAGRRSAAARDGIACAAGIAAFAACALLLAAVVSGAECALRLPGVCGRGLSFKADGFRALYACIAAFMWMMTTVFAREYLQHEGHRSRYHFFSLLTCGATLGVFLSGDFFTAFLFFEVMSFTSYVVVVQEESPAALRAGETYIAVAVLGGMVMLMGLFLLDARLGTLDFDELAAAAAALPDKTQLYLPGALILFGFGAKAGMFPLHIWLPKAHPVAPAPASALLSGILTKAGVFGILVLTSRVFGHDAVWGNAVLGLGTVTMVLGAVLAVFSVDLKRTLACSSMSQIGFILVGTGLQGLLGPENALAVWGTGLHMVNHSLFKLVLFLCAGAVYMNCHALDLNRIRGWGRGKPLLAVCFLLGALGLAGVPLGSGYISKTLLHEAIVEYIGLAAQTGAPVGLYHAVEWLFLFSGGLTAAYMTKLFVAAFIEKPNTPAAASQRPYMRKASALAIALPALALPVMGFAPDAVMGRMARLMQGFMNGKDPEHAVAWFSFANLRGAAVSLAIGAAVYLLFIRIALMHKDAEGVKRYVDRWPKWLDLEELVYRPLLVKFLPFVGALLCRALDALAENAVRLVRGTLLRQQPIPPRREEDLAPGDFTPHVRRSYTLQRIFGSVSYSLLLFGLGFCAAMGYLILILILK